MMQQFEIDWCKELSKRYIQGELLSNDDLHRLSYLRNRYICEVTGENVPPATYMFTVHTQDDPGAMITVERRG